MAEKAGEPFSSAATKRNFGQLVVEVFCISCIPKSPQGILGTTELDRRNL